MKKVWKWIIGIVLGLVVLVVLVGVGFVASRNFRFYRTEAQVSRGFSQRGPQMMPYGGFGYMRGPGMMGHGMMPFGGFFGGLLCLGFLVLVVLGIIWLVTRPRTSKPVETTTAVQPSAPAEMPAAIVNSCKKCGRPIQSDWSVCPYCGKKI